MGAARPHSLPPLAETRVRTHPHTLTRMNGTVKGTAQRVRQGEKLVNRYHRGVCKGPENGTRTGNRDSDAIHQRFITLNHVIESSLDLGNISRPVHWRTARHEKPNTQRCLLPQPGVAAWPVAQSVRSN